ncbi:hypothetical protein RCL1_005143 [Eukaryota sp. TZLM3-RCL]
MTPQFTVFYDEADVGLSSSGNVNDPILRKRLIISALKDTSFSIQLIPSSPTEDLTAILKVHNADYLQFLKNVYQSWKDEGSIEDFLAGDCIGIIPYTFPSEKARCRFLSSKNKNKLPFIFQIGLFASDTITPIYSYTYNLAISSVNLALKSLDVLLEQPVGSIVFSMTTFPGHHCCHDKYAGYCFLNNAAITATSALDKNQSVALIDLDYHAGDGTRELLEGLDNVLVTSIHADPICEYPFFSCYDEESCGNVIVRTLPPHSTIDNYLIVLKSLLVTISEFNPDLFIISFGSDTVIGDTDRTNGFGLDLEIQDYITIGEVIGSRISSRVLVLSEGGYRMDAVGEVTRNFLNGLENSRKVSINCDKENG